MAMNLSALLRWPGLAAGMLFACAALVVAWDGAGAAEPAVVRIAPPSAVVGIEESAFTVDVTVSGISNLGAYSVELRYEPGVIAFKEVVDGGFLGGTGRQISCPSVRAGSGSVMFGCGSLGQEPPGPGGAGVLARFTFAPVAPGTSELAFSRIDLADPISTDGGIPFRYEQGIVKVLAEEEPKPVATLSPPTPRAGALTPTVPPDATATVPETLGDVGQAGGVSGGTGRAGGAAGRAGVAGIWDVDGAARAAASEGFPVAGVGNRDDRVSRRVAILSEGLVAVGLLAVALANRSSAQYVKPRR